MKTLHDLGKILWDNQTEVIYFFEGNVSTAAEYDEVVLKFTDTSTPGTLTVGSDTKVSVRSLVVGGGGAGGTATSTTAGAGGGGGAGGFVDQTQMIEEGTYIITVGAGGVAATSTETATRGGDGNDSSFIGGTVSITAKGGGGGGAKSVGNPGGSGGGGSYASAACNGGATNGLYYVRGSAGGKGATKQYGAGGGGAGGSGKNTTTTAGPGAGGIGLTSDIVLDENGDAIYYAGGGGGGSMTTRQTAKSKGGGGAGAKGGDTEAGAGDDGFGGGGGGGGNACVGGKGGNGVVILRIRDLIISPPDYVELEWNGEEQIGYEPKNYYEFVGGTTNATLAGTYTYQIKPAGEFEWKDWTVSNKETKTVEWKIVALKVEIPTSVVITYDGAVHEVASSDEIYEIVDGTAVATNAGEYYFTLRLRDTANTVWADGTTTDKTTAWSIVAKPVEKPASVGGLIYSGTNAIVFTEYEGVVYKEGLTNSVNAGYFHYTVALDNPAGYTNYVWSGESGDASVANVRIDWEIASQLVDVPVARTGLVYDGESQNAFESLDWSHYSLVTGSTTNETAGGSYEAVFHLSGNDEAENFVWKVGETSSNYTVPWSIGADTNEIYELQLVGWRIGGTAKTPTISAKWGVVPVNTVEYYYGFGDDAESVTSWTNDTDAITTPGTWVLRAVIPATSSWTAATNTTTFLMWDDPGMLFHNWTEIRVEGTTNVLSNFIVPIRVSEERMPGFYYDEASPTNLVFIDDLGNLLTYDVDTWNTSGESVVWVKLVTLPMAGMPVTMYWNLREGQVAPENTSADVWSDYIGVWHMSEPSGGIATVKDASGHQNGTGHGSSLVADGIFGKSRGRNVTGAKGYAVAVPEYPELDALSDGAFTISGWINLNNTATAWAYLFARKNNDDYSGWAAQFRGSNGNTGNNDGISFFTSGGGNRYTFITTGKFTTAGVWMKYDFVRSGTTLSFYLNGILVNTVSGINPVVSGDQPFTIGGMNVESTDANKKASTLNGYSDEVRLMPAAIDSAHIAADYKYQSDPTMSTNGIVYLDGLKVDYWVVEPEMDKTTWDVTDTVKGQITNPGQLRYGEVTNYIYSVYDESETYSTPAAITSAGNYRVVFTQVDTNGYQRIEKVFEIRVTKSKPYTKIGGTNGNSGRVLLMNRDSNAGVPTKDRCPIDRQGYSDTSSTQSTFWQIFGTDEEGLSFNLKPGANSTLWTRNYGEKLWHLENCRHGNTYEKNVESGDLKSGQNYLPYSSTSYSIDQRTTLAKQFTAGQVVMRNIVGAAVYSPCYTNGIGTIYFDAVNGWAGDTDNYKIVVEYATNTVDHLEPIDANCVSIETNIVDEVDSIGYMVVTNGDEVSTNYYVVVTNDYGKLDGCWHAAEMIPFMRDTADGTGTFDRLDGTSELALAVTHGGTKGNFYRVAVPLDYHEFIRFRIRRISNDSGWENPDVYALILLDNIIASVPAMGGALESRGHFDESKTGHEILGWELATSVPYPSIYDGEIIGGAKPSFLINAGDGTTTWNTNDFFQSATMHYRWRYLNQTVGSWRTIELNPHNGFKAMSKFELPGRACDVEYWYDYRLQAPYYEYVDYSGIGKQIKYSEERGMQTNRLGGATLASAGTDWFFRVREGKSDYSVLDIVFRRGASAAPERVHMTAVGNHVWRGFVQTKENQAGEITYRIEALDEQTAEFAEYAATTNYWRCRTDNPRFPVSDSLELGTVDSWSTLTLDAVTGYVMFQIEDKSKDSMALTVVHADYQDVNAWSDALGCTDSQGRGPIFVGTSTTNAYKIGVSPKKQKFTDDFSGWGNMAATNESWTFPVGLTDIRPERMYGRKAYVTFTAETNGLWDVGQGMWVAKKYMVATNNAGVALQMEGNGKGYFQFYDEAKAPRGLESLSFNARLGQFVRFDDFAYYYADNILNISNYTFMARTAFDLESHTSFDGNASLSLVANYLPNKGCYEARWEWLGNGSTADRGQRLCLYRWNVVNGAKKSELIIARTNTVFNLNKVTALANNDSNLFTPMFISVSNDVPNKCTYVVAGIRRCGVALGTSPVGNGTPGNNTNTGRNSNWLGVCFKDTDQTKRLQKGSYGVLSANCDGVFARPEFSHTVQTAVGTFPGNNKVRDSFDNATLNQISNLQDIKNCAKDDLQDAEYPGWNIIQGRLATRYDDEDVNAIMSAPLEQYLQIYLGTAGRTDWGSTPYTNIALKSFGGGRFDIPLYTTKDCSVKFAVAGTIEDVRTDIVIDSVVLKQWRGGDWNGEDVKAEHISPSWASAGSSEMSPIYTNFVFTSCWTKDHDILMSAKRSDFATPCAIRSPLMDGKANNGYGGDGYVRGVGLGMISFEYKNAQENAVLLLQIATNRVDYMSVDTFDKSFSDNVWTTITNFNFGSMTAAQRKEGVLNTYLGLHSVTGMMRIVVSTNAIAAVAKETNPQRFGDVTITAISCNDEPPVDIHSWWGWNMRTVGGDADTERRMFLSDYSTLAGGSGLSLALNNSVDADYNISRIDVSDRESYIQHKPFVQTPTFTSNIVGEVSFRARKYAATDGIATVVLFGSMNASETDEGTWHRIDGAVFSVTNDWYETYSYKTDPGQNYKAFRLAVVGIEGISDTSGGGNGGLPEGRKPERVLLDELFVSEAVRARMGFRNVGCFKSDMSGIGEVPNVPSRKEQPMCGEAWGVQCEIYGAQLASDIDFDHTPRVRLHWFDKGSGVVTGGWSPWGYDKWKDQGSYHKSAWLVQATGVEEGRYVYRSSLMKSPESVISMSTAAPTYVQYMLEVIFYTKGSSVPVTNFLSRAEWGDDGKGPEWYRPLDLNAQNGGSTGSFAAYNILDNVAPGWAWINEVNVFGLFNSYLENSDENCQYIEIAQPPEADLSGWSVCILEAQTSNGLVVTNTLATFGSELEGTKDAKWIDPEANMVFRVIANQQARRTGQLKMSDGTLDGVWKLDNTYLTNMSGDSNGDTTISATKPFGLQLIRKSGIVEHEIVAMGTNWWNDLSIIYQRQYHPTNAVNFLNANIPGAQFFYVGMDDDGGETKSIGVFQNNGRTNDWNNTMKKSPGRKNPDQHIDPDHPVPSGENVLVYLTVSGDNIRQWDGVSYTNGLIMTMVTKGSQRGTNVVYEVSPWYEVGTVTTNGVSAAGNLVQTSSGNTQPRRYTLENVGKGASNNVTVVATAAPDSRFATLYGVDEDNPYRSAIIDWLGGGTDLYGNPFAQKDTGEIQLAEFRTMNNTFVTNMTLTEMYWLDMDPTVGGLALLGGMAEAPSVREVTLPSGATNTYLRMGVYLMITNENAILPAPAEHRWRGSNDKYTHWTPYALRGLDPGSNSLGYEQARDDWESVTFKLTGLLLTGNTNPKNIANWMPLRWFVFREDSFTSAGISRIEIEDPHSPDSIGYNTGWGQWWEKNGLSNPVYFWSIDTRLQPIGVEALKQENYYGN